MLEYLRRASMPTDLLGIIAEVRRRWRLKLAIRGIVRILAILLAFFLVAAALMQWDRFSPLSIVSARVLLVLTLLTSVFWFLVRPLRQRVTDEQVALYLEEHEPSLQATLLSAVESSRSGNEAESAALVKRVVEQALEVCANLNAAKRVEHRPLQRNGVALGAIAGVALLAILVGPAFIRHALSAMLRVASVQAASPYRIEVTPGNATVPKGADQTVTASLVGFGSEDVVLMVRRTPTGEFEPVPLVRNDDGKYEGAVFDVNAPTWYQVVADGVQSPVHTLQVVDVPYVQRLEIEYHFPAYTGLEPQKIEDGGDIAVLRGTEIRLRIFPTMKTAAGRITLNEKEAIELAPQADGSLTAAFKAERDGSYRVELKAPSGELAVASPQYTVDVLDDQAPSVSFNRPGRDTSASSIEEVFVEAAAEDDFGIRNLELVFSVNGGPEKVVKLFSGTSRLPEVTAGHTFYLEELGVETGDSVSYLRARGRQRLDRREDGVEQPVLPAHPAVQEGLQAGAVAGWRRRWWGWRGRTGRSALRTAAADHLGDVQRPARSTQSERGEVQRELHRRVALAIPPAGTGRRTPDADEQPAGRARSGICEDR